MNTLTPTVAEAFLLGVRADMDGDTENFVHLDDGRVWLLTVSETASMLDTMRALFQFLAPPPRIEDAEVRHLAAAWHSGQSSPLYALCSSGAIVSGVQREIRDALVACDDIRLFEAYAEHEGQEFSLQAADRNSLKRLRAYVRWHGLRGPVAGWSRL